MFCLDRNGRFSHENDRFSMMVTMMSLFDDVIYRVWIGPDLERFWDRAWDDGEDADRGHNWAVKNCYKLRRLILEKVSESVGERQRQFFVPFKQYYYCSAAPGDQSNLGKKGQQEDCAVGGGKKHERPRWR